MFIKIFEKLLDLEHNSGFTYLSKGDCNDQLSVLDIAVILEFKFCSIHGYPKVLTDFNLAGGIHHHKKKDLEETQLVSVTETPSLRNVIGPITQSKLPVPLSKMIKRAYNY